MIDYLVIAGAALLAVGVGLALGCTDLVAWMLQGGPDDAGAKPAECFICGDPATVHDGGLAKCAACYKGTPRRRDWA